MGDHTRGEERLPKYTRQRLFKSRTAVRPPFPTPLLALKRFNPETRPTTTNSSTFARWTLRHRQRSTPRWTRSPRPCHARQYSTLIPSSSLTRSSQPSPTRSSRSSGHSSAAGSMTFAHGSARTPISLSLTVNHQIPHSLLFLSNENLNK